MIYLASPYSHPEHQVEIERFRAVQMHAYRLIMMERPVVSPIAMCHGMRQRFSLPGDHEHWKHYNEGLLKSATELYLLTLNGWMDSIGMEAEYEYFERCGRDCFLVDARDSGYIFTPIPRRATWNTVTKRKWTDPVWPGTVESPPAR